MLACFDRKLGFIAAKNIALAEKPNSWKRKKTLVQKRYGCASLGFVLSCIFCYQTASLIRLHFPSAGTQLKNCARAGVYCSLSWVLLWLFFKRFICIFCWWEPLSAWLSLQISIPQCSPCLSTCFVCCHLCFKSLFLLLSSRKQKFWWLRLTGAQKNSYWRTGTSCKQ